MKVIYDELLSNFAFNFDLRRYNKDQAAALERAQRIMLRLRSRTTSAAFNAWRDETREQKHLRYSLQKLVARWQRLQLKAPFHDWVEWVEEVRGERATLRRVTHRMSRVRRCRLTLSNPR